MTRRDDSDIDDILVATMILNCDATQEGMDRILELVCDSWPVFSAVCGDPRVIDVLCAEGFIPTLELAVNGSGR